MPATRLQEGRPRPAGLELTSARIERVSGTPMCSMVPMNLCETPKTGDRGAIVRVTMREAGKDATTYYLCHACAEASGDLRT